MSFAEEGTRAPRHAGIVARTRTLIRAIDEGDDSTVERAVMEFSKSRRLLAPLALLVGAFGMLFQAVKLLVSNWRLTLIEILPAMWIWLAMLDLKAHAFRGRSFHIIEGPILIPVIAAITLITAGGFYLNAVFAFAVSGSGKPEIRPAFAQAREHLSTILVWGVFTGIALGVSTTVFPRWDKWWFLISLSIIVGFMMWAYVAVPSRIVGVDTRTGSRRDRLSASVIAAVVGAAVCSPPYALGRGGVLLLGSSHLFVLGIAMIAIGVTLQAGTSGAVKAVKMGAKLSIGRATDGSESAA
ncbi:MAG TPA: hypothetical protein VEJ87_04495 [Acidimicrobiales bacterium]|nr:hypothetical protein [Acidimicrobiales bacterium]